MDSQSTRVLRRSASGRCLKGGRGFFGIVRSPLSRMSRVFLRRTAGAACALFLGPLAPAAGGAERFPTPLEASAYQKLSSVADVSRFLAVLDRHDRRAKHVVLGRSAGGRPLDALLVSGNPGALERGDAPAHRLRIMLASGQHGNEASGTEAIMMLARDLLGGPRQTLLEHVEFILLPIQNPDGREAGRRKNDDGVDFSADFVALTQPETRLLIDALMRWQPDVFVDLHESAILKPRTLARHGYMTDFETQLEIGNNGNIDAAIAWLNRNRIRPAILSELQRRGQRAANYIREITNPNQNIKHGGLTLRNARNRAGITGAFSLLVENRLDPVEGDYPTPRNIAHRTATQLLSLEVLLETCRAQQAEIIARSRAARAGWRERLRPRVFLTTTYHPDPEQKTISITLRRIEDGKLETRVLPYWGRIMNGEELALPVAYALIDHHDRIGAVLERHHIESVVMDEPRRCRAIVQHVLTREAIPARYGHGTFRTTVEEREFVTSLPAGTRWIPLHQPTQRLIPLLLDPRSSSSLFDHVNYSALVEAGKDFFILRINRDCR